MTNSIISDLANSNEVKLVFREGYKVYNLKVKVSVSSMVIDKDSREKAEDLFNSIENLLITIDAFPKKLSNNSKLPEESIMSFLKVMTGSQFVLYSTPREGM